MTDRVTSPRSYRPTARGGGAWRSRVFTGAHHTERVYVARVGPLGVVSAVLMTGIMLAVLLVLLLGALLFWLPPVILFIAGVVIAGLLRARFGRAS